MCVFYTTNINDDGSTTLPTGDVISTTGAKGFTTKSFLNGNLIAEIASLNPQGDSKTMKFGNGDETEAAIYQSHRKNGPTFISLKSDTLIGKNW